MCVRGRKVLCYICYVMLSCTALRTVILSNVLAFDIVWSCATTTFTFLRSYHSFIKHHRQANGGFSHKTLTSLHGLRSHGNKVCSLKAERQLQPASQPVWFNSMVNSGLNPHLQSCGSQYNPPPPPKHTHIKTPQSKSKMYHIAPYLMENHSGDGSIVV